MKLLTIALLTAAIAFSQALPYKTRPLNDKERLELIRAADRGMMLMKEAEAAIRRYQTEMASQQARVKELQRITGNEGCHINAAIQFDCNLPHTK